MSTTPIGSTKNTSGSSPLPGSSTGTNGSNLSLNPSDFMNLMVKQLQNQDPLQPTDSSQLLSQMSQIGQLQSTMNLQSSLQTMVLQNQIGAAGNLIGKSVQGLDPQGNPLQGVVNSVKVKSDGLYLELDNNQELAMTRVTTISPAPAATAGTSPTTTTAGTAKAA